MVCRTYESQNCSAARTLEAIGDRWSPLIVQEALFEGITRFSDFERCLDIAPEVLAKNLNAFVESGLMELKLASKSSDTCEYVLTPKGRDLGPSMIALAAWGDHWAAPQNPPTTFEHDGFGGAVLQMIGCEACVEVPEADEVTARPGPGSTSSSSILAMECCSKSDVVPIPLEFAISLLGTFSVRIGGIVIAPIPVGTQRLLAYLALHDRAVTRLSMAGTMWPEVSEQCAGGSLRSALSRLDTPTRQAVRMATAGLRLDDNVTVDFRDAQVLAHRLLQPGAKPSEGDLTSEAVALLSNDLLPDWYDDWVVGEAEDWRQLRMNALEAQTRLLMDGGRWADAAGAARAAMKVEPLRESAHAILVQVHLAEGNQSEALRVFDRYRKLLKTELGLEPTTHLSDLIYSIQKQ